jgi:hypothetical protein
LFIQGRFLLIDTNIKEEDRYLNNINFINETNLVVELMGVCYGEFNGDSKFDTNLKNVSHTLRNLTLEDGRIYADVTILNTKVGKEVQELFKYFGNSIFDHIKFVPKILTRKYLNPLSMSEESEIYALRWDISYNHP